MKTKILLVITSLLMMMTAGMVTQAQDADQSILDLARDTDDLSTLVAAVEAADPAIAEMLANDGAYTVLAPSNQAFENLLLTLGMEAEDLLESAILTDILRYHVLDGEFFAEDIAALDDNFAGTIFPDNFIAVSVAEDGTITLNDVVNVIATDIDASNGVVHIIDDVLLPVVALEEFGLAEASNTNVQVLHFVPDAPPVDVYIDGEVAVANLGFGENSGYMTLASGDYEIAVAPAGTSIEDAIIGPATFTLENGEFLNIAAIGTLETGTLNVTTFSQSFPVLDDSEAGLTVVHAVDAAPDVDLVLDSEVAVENLAYPFTAGNNDGAFSLVVPTAFETLTVNLSGEETVLLDLSSSGLEAGTYYLLVVGGTVNAPMPYVFPIASTRADELNDALYDDMGEMTNMDDTESGEMMMSGTIAEIVAQSATAEEPEFTILLEAVQNADPAILETLQGTDAITVFAPTDEAFNNLLSSTGLSADELFESELLTNILLYHVVAGEVDSTAVVNMDAQLIPTMLEDTYIGVTVDDDGNVILNEIANVIQADVRADNGIIHVIDEVILPGYVVDELGL